MVKSDVPQPAAGHFVYRKDPCAAVKKKMLSKYRKIVYSK